MDPTKYDNILSILQQASNQKRKFSILNTDTGNTDDVDKPGRQKSHGYRKKDLITLLENDVGMFNILLSKHITKCLSSRHTSYLDEK